MSNNESTETTDPNAPVTPPPAEAPVIAPKVSGGLAPDINLPVRKVFTTAPQLESIQKDILGGTVADSGDAATRQRRGFDVAYQGQLLVNKSGAITRGQYDPDKEAVSELSRLSTTDRTDLQNKLASLGLYGKNGRASGGTGFDSTDLSVMREFLNYANSKGLTVDAALPTLLSEVKPVVGTGRVIRTTAKQDIRSVLQKTTQEILGRSLSPNEIEKFVKTYERMEITEAMGGVRAPNLAVAAEEQVQQQFGPEAQAVGALGLFDILDRKIKGQA
jgi:hypothetical protein